MPPEPPPYDECVVSRYDPERGAVVFDQSVTTCAAAAARVAYLRGQGYDAWFECHQAKK